MSPSANGPQSSPSTLAGQPGQGAPPQSQDSGSGDSGDSGLRMVISKIREMETDLVGISQSFPSVGPSASKAIDAIRSVLRQIIANPGGPEPASPNIGG